MSEVSKVTFCAGPRVSTMVSGDGDIPLGSIIVPLHANCLASSASAAVLKQAMISDAAMLGRNIDKATYIWLATRRGARTKRHIPWV